MSKYDPYQRLSNYRQPTFSAQPVCTDTPPIPLLRRPSRSRARAGVGDRRQPPSGIPHVPAAAVRHAHAAGVVDNRRSVFHITLGHRLSSLRPAVQYVSPNTHCVFSWLVFQHQQKPCIMGNSCLNGRRAIRRRRCASTAA